MKSLPKSVAAYQRTSEFTETSIPAGLRRRHATKPGVWARIQVEVGALRYRILEPEIREYELTPERSGVVEPEVPHEVEPIGSVRFFVEFFRAPD